MNEHEATPSMRGAAVVRQRSALTGLALIAILILAGWLRLANVNWDDGHHLHPDERFLTMVGTAIQLPSSVAEYFDTRSSPLNPYNRGHNSFVYGTYPLFLVRALAEPLRMQAYDKIHLLGRQLSALHDVGTVLLVFLIGARLYGRRVGLLASLLLAATALHIQQAHFFTVDSYLTFYLAVAFYAYSRGLDSRHPGWYALAGVGLGIATASKINALLFVVVLGTAVAAHWIKRGSGVLEDHRPFERDAQAEVSGGDAGGRRWSPFVGAIAVGLIALAVFRVAQPYAFAGPSPLDVFPNPAWITDLTSWSRIASGEGDYPPSHQWASTTPYLFPLRHMVLWGLGLPLGVAAFAGFALACVQLARARTHSLGTLLVLVWITVNVLYWGGQMAKTMRYLLPIYPFLAILGAYFGFWILDFGLRRLRAESKIQNPRPKIALAFSLVPLLLVTGYTLFYGLAFSAIYSRPVTRVEASTWIYDNLPPGTAFAWEHWDDPLPLRLPGRDGVEDCAKPDRNPTRLCSFQLTLYDDDTIQKRDTLVAILNEVDYVFLSSNRLYDSIPRLPMRYPLTTEYYRLLFGGELGFRLEHSFTSHPSLLGIRIDDDSAEEAFTVYDHPKVLIFRKTTDYSSARVRELLSRVSLDNVVRLRPSQVPTAGLLLSPPDRVAQQAGGTWSGIFDRDGVANQVPVLAWLIALQVMAFAIYPVVWWLLRGLADRGYLLAKLLGLVAVSYLAWLLASYHILPFERMAILVAVLLVGGLSAWVLRDRGYEFATFLRARWRLLAVEESLFLVAFGGFLLIRAANPDLWHSHFGGEKPMDFAYLNAVIKSTYFPPYDPWFAGGYINYYYFGHVLTATLIKLTGVVPWVAYNLAVPLYFALTAGAAFSFGHSLMAGHGRTARWPSHDTVGTGVLGAALVAVAGNLDGLGQVAEGLAKIGGFGFQSRIPGLAGVVNGVVGLRVLFEGKPLPPFDFWRSTRVIGPEDPGPISEFPYFTFLYGDLHAHLIALPVTIAVVVVGLSVLREAEARTLLPDWQRAEGFRALLSKLVRSHWLWLVVLLSLLLGTLRATNTWDFPTYTLLAVAAFALAHYRLWRTIDSRGVIWTAAAAGGLVALPMLLYLPYVRNYALFYTGVEPVKHATALILYLVIFGAFVLFIGGFAVVETWRVLRRLSYPWWPEPAAAHQYHAGLSAPVWIEQLELRTLPTMGLLFLAAGFSLAGRQTAAFLAAAMALVAFHTLRPRQSVELRYVWVMVGLALTLTLVPEFVALKGDIGRMNTVFKFYLQAWVLLALAAAVALPYAERRLKGLAGPRSTPLRVWRFVVIAVLFSVSLYPVLATGVKLKLRFEQSPPSLDGMAYMERAVYSDQGRPIPLGPDFQAINWLLDNVQGSPVIVEAVTPLYRWGSRVAIYTGLPTVLGWDWHQKQQRGDFSWMIDERAQQVKTFYETTSMDGARQFLQRYGVRYVYVGPLERLYYPPQGLAKFEQMAGDTLSVAYRSADVTIYRVDYQ